MGIKFEFFKAGNGDSILVSTDEGTNILIDGGHKSLYTRELKKLKKKLPQLDLMIMTHLDDDHILGLRDLLNDDVKKIIKNNDYVPWVKEVWFNSFNKTSNTGDELFTNPFESDNASIGNQLKFNKFMSLANKKSKKINYRDYISVDTIINPIVIGDIKIILLSPNDNKLQNLYKKYKRKLKSQNLFFSTNAKDANSSIKTLSNKPFSKDTSVSNGSSIAFILIYNSQKFLFLGDAHIPLVNENLEIVKSRYFQNEEKIKFEFIKLSHHGSKNNINKDFLNLVETDNYIVLTDTKKHKHPDKETLSKIISHHKELSSKVTFIFNYSDGAKEKRYKFTDEDKELYQDYFELTHCNKYP